MAWNTPSTATVGQLATSSFWNAQVRDNFNAVADVGEYKYIHRAATAVETVVNGGWVECNGIAISRATYSALFAKFATTYGVGDGTTTFNLPDFRGRVPIGLADASGHADVKTLGTTDGVAIANRRPKHRHSAHNHTQNAHGHTANIEVAGGGASRFMFAGASSSTSTPSTDPIAQTTATNNPADGGSGNANDALDAPAHIVAGIWVVKF